MARKVRVFVKDTAQHIMLKSLNTLNLFKDSSDFEVFIKILQKLNDTHFIKIHAYILMPHFFEFLATPKEVDTMSRFMQSLGRQYVGYFNKKYNHTGTLWEGRYKSSLVEGPLFLLDVTKYIEKKAPKDYVFCSIRKNLFAQTDKIISLSSQYKRLGYTKKERLKRYSEIFNSLANTEKDEFITTCIEKQLVTGSAKFIEKIEKQVGMTLTSKNRGRPKIQKRNKMYKKLVVLDKSQHKDLKINSMKSLLFAKNTSIVPIISDEITQIGSMFPIVFANEKNGPVLSTVVSLGGDCLAINDEGKWINKNIPSFFMRYPFSLGHTKDNPNQKIILIDEDSHLLSKSKGKQLFKKNGEKSEVLQDAVEFLTKFEDKMLSTAVITKLIFQSGILEAREITVGEGDEKKVLIKGFKVVNKEKLDLLSDEILANWARTGIMILIDAHLKSLKNVQNLFNIAHQRQN